MLHLVESIDTSDAIVDTHDTAFLRAVCTAVERALGLDTMSDDSALAVRAGRRQCVNRALETVEDVRFSGVNHFKGLVVVVSADFAYGHGILLVRTAGLKTRLYRLETATHHTGR
jgi:hypothetical protein